jgi:hypothetical protein
MVMIMPLFLSACIYVGRSGARGRLAVNGGLYSSRTCRQYSGSTSIPLSRLSRRFASVPAPG